MGTQHSSHIRLSHTELICLADAYVQRHGDGEVKLHLVQGCQDVLEVDRRREKLPYSLLKVLNLFIEGSRAREPQHESTGHLREAGVIGDRQNGRVNFYTADAPSELEVSNIPQPPVTTIRITPLPIPVVKSRPATLLISDVQEITGDLIEINRLVLRLKAAEILLLSTASDLDAKRIQSLIIQATNGLVFFEEIATVARRL